jgi:2-desacetyl-2-hydroxyethyl bacteriochlorophyllide A dehydrogenase
MKAIVNTAPGKLEMLDWPMPQPAVGQVRIRTGACAICATDLLMIAGWDRTGFPAIPGHEWAGTVDAVGPGANASLVGKKCVAENVLADGLEVGFEHPGGYAQYLVTEAANVRPLPDDFDLTAAALIEPLAVCMRGMHRLRDGLRGPILIFGDGPIGLLLTSLLAGKGHRDITLAGGRDARLALARELGAARTVNYHKLGDNLVDGIQTSGTGKFATVIEASGSGAAIDACIKLAAHDARVLVLGDYREARASFTWNTLLLNELELIGSNASAGGWNEAVALAVAGKVNPAKLITHRLPAESFQEGVELMRSRRGDVIKVVLNWE